MTEAVAYLQLAPETMDNPALMEEVEAQLRAVVNSPALSGPVSTNYDPPKPDATGRVEFGGVTPDQLLDALNAEALGWESARRYWVPQEPSSS